MTGAKCPLCGSPVLDLYARTNGRAYHRCATCALVHLEPALRPTPLEEVRRYLEHENDVGDLRYRAFLDRLAAPLRSRLRAGAEGLDFGCGPGPALAAMMCEAGFPTAAWDPVFRADDAVLARDYDFVTCTEVVEHLHEPAATFDRLARLLRPGGMLAVMTRFYPAREAFVTWHYLRDPTHVLFWSEETFRWIAAAHGWTLELPAPDVVLMRAGAGGRP
ncbi:MAG TPA: methyltransferase domain-containing protein [Gemmatimonadaceae bacterium]|nr:methyltransferase domain-containing protein [Gemmatimonadaceae bacterium]